MSSEPIQSLLGRLDDTPIRDAPVTDLVSRGHQLKRRRRRRQAAVAVVAVAVVAVGATTSVTTLRGDAPTAGENETAIDPADGATTDPTLSAPAGTRLVAVGEVMVAVPASWGTGVTECLKPVAPTVYVEFGIQADCITSPTGRETQVPHLAIFDTSGNGAGNALSVDGDLEPAGSVGGLTVLDSEVRCGRDTPPLASPTGLDSCSQIVAVPDSEVAFVATAWGSNAKNTVTDIRNSLQEIPDNYVAVPLVADRTYYTPQPGDGIGELDRLRRTIEETGLRVETVTEYRPNLEDGSFLGVDPGFASPVPLGTTLTLRVSSDTSE